MKYQLSVANTKIEFNTITELQDWVTAHSTRGTITFIPEGTGDASYVLSSRKVDFGTAILKEATALVGAQDNTPEQIGMLFESLNTIRLLLETGALGTARDAIGAIKPNFPEYDVAFTYIIEQINTFEVEYGL